MRTEQSSAEHIKKRSNPLKAGFGYSVANILIKSIGILTLPLFSRLLSTEEYGVYSVFMAYTTMLSYVIGLTLNISIKSANIEFPSKIDDYTSSISMIYKINLILYVVVMLIGGSYISSVVGLSKSQLLLLGINAEATAFFSLYSVKVSLKYSYIEYLKWAAINSIGGIVFSLVLMLTVFSDNHLAGRLVGSTTVLAFASFMITIKLYKQSRPKYNKEFWEFGIKYSLPIVPNGIAQVLLNQFDRVMIRYLSGDSFAGIYSFAGNIKLIVTVISDSIGTVWSTWFFDTMSAKQTEKIQQRSFQTAFSFMTFGNMLMAISPELLLLLGNRDYYDGKLVVIPMIADSIILFFYILVVQGEYYKKKTVFVLIGTMAAALLNVILNYIYIIKYGYIAAAYTTLFSYLCYLFLHIFISKNVLGFYIIKLKNIIFLLVLMIMYMVTILIFLDFWIIRWALTIPYLILSLLMLNHSLKKSDNIDLKELSNNLIRKRFKEKRKND